MMLPECLAQDKTSLPIRVSNDTLFCKTYDFLSRTLFSSALYHSPGLVVLQDIALLLGKREDG
jgi:hypothetical protein